MKTFKGQETSLEASKGFYRGSRSSITVPKIHARTYENLYKSIQIYKIRWKSSEDKKLAWNREKDPIGSRSFLTVLSTHAPKSIKITEIAENQRNHVISVKMP